jgi:multidrug resistance efflux pump
MTELMNRTQALEQETATEAAASSPTTASDAVVPTPPEKRAPSGAFRKWRNRGVVLLMVAAAVFTAVRLTQSQAAARTKLHLDDVVLTAQPIAVQTTQPGLVTQVSIRAGERVTSGERLGSIDVTATNAKGKPVTTAHVLRAPRTGIVVDDPAPVGSTLQPGTAFVQMYAPAQLQLVTSVPLSYLSKIRSGMTAELTASGVPGKVKATLLRAVPRIGSAAQDVPRNDLQLVFVATQPAQVAKLIPGLRFSGSIDTRTGSGDSNSAQYVGGS